MNTLSNQKKRDHALTILKKAQELLEATGEYDTKYKENIDAFREEIKEKFKEKPSNISFLLIKDFNDKAKRLDTSLENKPVYRSYLNIIFAKEIVKDRDSKVKTIDTSIRRAVYSERNKAMETKKHLLGKLPESEDAEEHSEAVKLFKAPVDSTNYVTYNARFSALDACFLKYIRNESHPEEDRTTAEKYHGNLIAIRAHLDRIVPEGDRLELAQLPHEYRALKLADQRQLLMLLVGDVPAAMFVQPNTGYIRSSRQISFYIMHLLKPYHMSTTFLGRMVARLNYGINMFTKMGKYLVIMAAWWLTCALQWLTTMYLAFMTWQSPWLWKGVMRMFYCIVHGLYFVGGLFNKRISTKHLSKAFFDRLGENMLTGAVGTAMLGYLFYQLSEIAHDSTDHMEVPYVWWTWQKAMDAYKITWAAHYLAELEPGVFGDHTVSGISDAQLAAMRRVQYEMEMLDEMVNHTVRANLHAIMNDYKEDIGFKGQKFGSYEKGKLFLELNAVYTNAGATAVNPRILRQQLLRKFPHEFRAHHFFNQYGFPRTAMQIVLAFFYDWDRRRHERGGLPTVPYNDNQFHTFMEMFTVKESKRGSKTFTPARYHCNPIQVAEWERKHSKDALISDSYGVAQTASEATAEHIDDAITQADIVEQEGQNVNNTGILTRKLNLTQLFLYQPSFDGWVAANIGSSPTVRAFFQRYSGWTHKLSDPLLHRLKREFDLGKAVTLKTAYLQYNQRQLTEDFNTEAPVEQYVYRLPTGDGLRSVFMDRVNLAGKVRFGVQDVDAIENNIRSDFFSAGGTDASTRLTDLFRDLKNPRNRIKFIEHSENSTRVKSAWDDIKNKSDSAIQLSSSDTSGDTKNLFIVLTNLLGRLFNCSLDHVDPNRNNPYDNANKKNTDGINALRTDKDEFTDIDLQRLDTIATDEFNEYDDDFVQRLQQFDVDSQFRKHLLAQMQNPVQSGGGGGRSTTNANRSNPCVTTDYVDSLQYTSKQRKHKTGGRLTTCKRVPNTSRHTRKLRKYAQKKRTCKWW